ncbi:hypothetical protein C8R44DRAFT_750271 [Mycena epipterygia]|nr:hypothetical protein C8R44DRAFT_750271 [Mycena epipterygia]
MSRSSGCCSPTDMYMLGKVKLNKFGDKTVVLGHLVIFRDIPLVRNPCLVRTETVCFLRLHTPPSGYHDSIVYTPPPKDLTNVRDNVGNTRERSPLFLYDRPYLFYLFHKPRKHAQPRDHEPRVSSGNSIDVDVVDAIEAADYMLLLRVNPQLRSLVEKQCLELETGACSSQRDAPQFKLPHGDARA